MPTPTLHDPALCQALLRRLEDLLDRPMRFMEVCGTHTVSIFRGGLRSLLPATVTHLTGPGCPVCVTHDREVAAFLRLAEEPGVIIATFGDLMRVPGPDGRSLKHAQAEGARVSVVYSPLDALTLAAEHPDATVVFLGVGFETTAPAVAATVLAAEARGLDNFALFSCHKLVPPALAALLADADNAIDAFIAGVLTQKEKADWIAKLEGVTLGSDAFFPFGDNVERAHQSGVVYIAQPGGSIRDDQVIETADKFGMVMAFTGMRLFHH